MPPGSQEGRSQEAPKQAWERGGGTAEPRRPRPLRASVIHWESTRVTEEDKGLRVPETEARPTGRRLIYSGSAASSWLTAESR